MKELGGNVDHVGIAVRSIDSALPLWTALGFEPAEGSSGDEIVEGGSVRAVLLGGSSRIELLEDRTEAGRIGRFIDTRGEGIHHVALRVDDLEESIQKGRVIGLETVGEIREGVDGRRIIFFHPRTSHGALIELVEGEPGVSRGTSG